VTGDCQHPPSRTMQRRQFLTFGTLAALSPRGDSAQVLANASAAAHSPRAKRCLILFLTGGPSQLDTWDMKPHATREIRGDFSPIETRTPGIFISELFPRLAEVSNRFRLIRSLTHQDTVHASAGYAMLTGQAHRMANMAVNGSVPPSPDDRPNLGSTVFHSRRHLAGQLPPFALPEIIKDAAVNEVPGQNSGFLGKQFDPVLFEANHQRTQFLTPLITLPGSVTSGRMRARMQLRQSIDDRMSRFGELKRLTDMESDYHRGLALLNTETLQKAFDLDAETHHTREAYGTHLFGQGALLARRLLEADATFVTVYWHYEGPDDSPVWDTHWNNSQHLRERLAGPADRAVSAVLTDLHDRGLLDETLVLCLGEFGRTPRINRKAGRDHWPHAFTALVAGAGVSGSSVFGATDSDAAYPLHDPVTAEDFCTTVLDHLGVSADYEFHDQFNRPHRAATGRSRPEIFG
jgi:hypothetical protein